MEVKLAAQDVADYEILDLCPVIGVRLPPTRPLASAQEIMSFDQLLIVECLVLILDELEDRRAIIVLERPVRIRLNFALALSKELPPLLAHLLRIKLVINELLRNRSQVLHEQRVLILVDDALPVL